jgi:carbon monoxide dehydrogenase subunit G
MKLEQSFEVEAPLERVWQALIDVERVAPCLPGASVTGRNDDGTYDGTFTIKIGPTTASYAGKLELAEIDESGHRATLKADGTDKRGQGGANATIVSTVSSGGNGATKVEVSTDYRITGRLARFGRGGMIEDISERLLREFATRLQQSLGGSEEGPAAESEEAPAAAAQAPPPTAEASEPEPATQAEAAAPTQAEAAEPTQAQGPPPPYAPPPPRIQEPAAPLDAGSLVGGVLVERMRRNPAPLAFFAGLLLAMLLRRRR